MTSQRWQAEILAGVETIPHTGAIPGTLTLLDRKACIILPGTDIWIAATELGHGRVLVVAHEGYLTGFQSPGNDMDNHIEQLHLNMKYWLTKGQYGHDNEIGVLGHITKASLSQFKILLWNGADDVRDVTSDDLILFVRNGGAVLHCMCSWGWLQLKPGKTLYDMPYKSFLDIAGINYNNASVCIPKTGIDVRQLVPPNIIYPRVARTPLSATPVFTSKDARGEQWRTEILRGVTTIPNTGAVPGSIVLFGDSARPILSGTTNVDVWIAGAHLGGGRILVVAHEGYLNDFNKSHTDVNLMALHSNMKQWLTKNKFRNNADIIYADSPKRTLVPGNGSILVWSGQKNVSFSSEEVLNFIKSGGAFLHTMCPWGWLCLNPGLGIDDMPMSDVLNLAGVTYTKRYVQIPQDGLDVFQCTSSDSCHLGHAVDALAADSNNLSNVGDAMELVTELTAAQLKIFSENLDKLEKVVESSKFNYEPSKNCPVSSKEGKALMGLCEVLLKTGKMKRKLPGIDQFPGEFSVAPPKLSVRFLVTSHIKDVHPTGYYVEAGEYVSITVISTLVVGCEWSVQVGAHSDCLTGQDQLKRWPNVICSEALDKQTTVLQSTFGGLVYLLSPDGMTTIEVQMDNVIESPFFDVTIPSTVTNWKNRRNAPGLWADISSEFLTITLPSSSIRNLDNPMNVMQTWDRVLKAHFHLRGSDIRKNRRQWVVTDVQPSVGYMHSGYPVVTHLDIADPCHEFHLLNNEALCSTGFWGLFHEFGHNMQRSVWTFPGTTEVTVNIFTLHAMETISKQSPWIHSWLLDQIPNATTYLNGDATYSRWKSDPGIALFIYAQIIHQFGWVVMKDVFRRYELMDENSKPTQEGDQIDLWYILLSDICGHNLAPLVDFWKIPLSEKARGKMGRYLPFLPDDKLTGLACARERMILNEYTNCLRCPTHILSDNYVIEVSPPVLQQPRMTLTMSARV